MNFRQDINGLRAYAVLAVVLFHFQVPGFGGGFVGVDIFFVISGYLMTRIIEEGVERGTRGWLLTFYLGRARRIVPALLLVCATMLAVGWFLLPASAYQMLSAHGMSALAFLSNIRFWREAGYFDTSSHEKWLLHTWSLSVEWQFYLLYPVALMLCWRFVRRPLARQIAIATGILASLVLSVVITPNHPEAAFFLLPTRIWELLAGAMVFLLAKNWQPAAGAARLVEAVGFMLIFSAVLIFNAETPWPSGLALVPVLGSVLVLLAARQNSLWTQSPVFQAMGNWSYSIYLWHWPLVVLLVYMELMHDIRFVLLGLAVATGLGWLCYTWVEQPARRVLSRGAPLPALASIAVAVSIVAVPAYLIRAADGVSGRLSSETERIAAESNNFNPRGKQCHSAGGYDFRRCTYGGRRVRAILIGDSHADSVVTAVQQALPSPEDGILAFTYTSCPTIFGVKKRDRPDLKCAEFNDWVMGEIATIATDVPVVIVNRSSGNVFGSNRSDDPGFGQPTAYFDKPLTTPTPEFQAQFAQRLADTACKISKTRPVYLVRPFPEMPVDVPKVAARRQLMGIEHEIAVSLDEYHRRHHLVWAAQDQAHANCGVEILDPLQWLCEATRCNGLLNGRPLYYDSHHLSEYGNRLLVPMFRTVMHSRSTETKAEAKFEFSTVYKTSR